jgi:insulysin
MKKLIAILFCQITCTLFAEDIQDLAKTPILTPYYKDQVVAKIKLKNGLRGYLVSNPNFKQSGACLVVQTGAWNDPQEFPGLAHFVEHTLFLGTEKYPEESGFSKFIDQNNGLTNAYTTYAQTAYVFEVDNQAFKEGLDRFAQFFIHPLFNPSGIEREMHAVDQEFQMKKKDDTFRYAMIQSEFAAPDHPFKKFIAGNLKSLEKADRPALVSWYESHYSADRMTLVVMSDLPIDQMKELVTTYFEEIPNKPIENAIGLGRATNPAWNQHYVYIEPIKNSRKIELVWELPQSFAKQIAEQPDTAICFVLGHEAKGSLLDVLKQKELATALSCGKVLLDPNTMLFFIEIEVTQKGLKEKNQVISTVFEAIKRIEVEGISQELFSDIQKMEKIKYQYKGREDIFDALMQHSFNIVNEPLQTYPEMTFIPQKYDAAMISTFAKALSPKDVRVDILAKKEITHEDYNKKEAWLEVPYTMQQIDPEMIAAWSGAKLNQNMVLPTKNPFLPSQLSAMSSKEQDVIYPIPQKVFDQESGIIFFAKDQLYHLPKISWTFTFLSPLFDLKNPQSIAALDLYIKIAKEELNPLCYLALMGGLELNLTREENKLCLEIKGFSEHAPLFLSQVLKTLENLEVNASTFAIQKENLSRSYDNFTKEGSLQRAAESLKQIIYENFVTEKQKGAALKKITHSMMQSFAKLLQEKLYVQGMLYGNMTEEQSQKVAQAITEWIKAPFLQKDHQKQKVVNLSENRNPTYIEEMGKSQGNAVILAIETDGFSFEKRAAQQIVMQAIKNPFFETLRTKQQTAYAVISYPEELDKKLFSFFAVQSDSHGVKDLLFRFDQFIEDYVQAIGKEELTQNEFQIIKETLARQLSEPPKTMEEMGALLHLLAFKYDADFHWMEKRLEGVKNMDWQKCLSLAKQLLGKQNRRRLAILWKGETSQSALNWTRQLSLKKMKELSNYE